MNKARFLFIIVILLPTGQQYINIFIWFPKRAYLRNDFVSSPVFLTFTTLGVYEKFSFGYQLFNNIYDDECLRISCQQMCMCFCWCCLTIALPTTANSYENSYYWLFTLNKSIGKRKGNFLITLNSQNKMFSTNIITNIMIKFQFVYI